MKLKTLALAGAMTAALMAFAPAADAAILNFDFSSGGTNAGSGFGNVRTFSNSGLTVTITSWGVTGIGSTFQSAQTGQFGSGLGICNREEGTNCSSPSHTADNIGANDAFLIQFSEAVDPLSLNLSAFGDTDISYWVGTLTPAGVDGRTLAQVQATIGSAELTNDGGSSDRVALLTSGNVTALFIGPRNSHSDDRFKLDGISVDRPTNRVPEPASLALFGASLLGLGALRRRK